MGKKLIVLIIFQICSLSLFAQINTDRVLAIGRNALYFEDYVLSIQYFNQVIKSKPWMAEPYFYRAVAKINLDDYKGAEEDCTLCLERNSFLVQAYYARGIARHSQDDLEGAIEDYNNGLQFRPEDRQMLVNKAVAFIQKKDFEGAENAFEALMKAHPRNSVSYLTRGAMYIEQGDTVKALADYNKAVELDPYYAPAYGNRAILLYQTNDLDGALEDLDRAIHLDTRQSGFYINRGLVRYQLNDLRGAMMDYDQVIGIDSRNLIARFNRGLLRFQVGDYNRAIEDFDLVIELEPDNFMAYYNRALLRFEIADYRGSISDFNVVLHQYPNFIPGYYSRAEAKRKINDKSGADKDMWTAFEIEERMSKGNRGSGLLAGTNQSPSDNDSDEQVSSEEENEENTREQSDKNINKFNRLVVFDKDTERKSKYQSEVRGRVQDRNVQVDLEPQFVLTYYEKPEQVKTIIYYNNMVESYNNQMLLKWKIRLTNQEAALTEDQVSIHFASIDDLSSRIGQGTDPNVYFGRAIDHMLVQDFSAALDDYTKAITLDPSFAMAYFNRAVVRYKQLEYNLSQMSTNTVDDFSSTSLTIGGRTVKSTIRPPEQSAAQSKDNLRSYEHELIIRDYDMVIRLNPDFVYAYFNRGNLRCSQRDYRAAIQDYNEAIERDPNFADAYFNRGLARLSLGDANRGIADLSKAGELGIINAYNIIKRMTSN